MNYFTEAIYLSKISKHNNIKKIYKTLIDFNKIKGKCNPYIYKIINGKLKKVFSKEKILNEMKQYIIKMVEQKQTIFINTINLSKSDIEYLLEDIQYPTYFVDNINKIHIKPKHKIYKKNIDIIGDIHGLYDSFLKLLQKMGYFIKNNQIHHPNNRKIVFLGDIINKGPDSLKVLKLIMNSVQNNGHHMILGNHEYKLLELLQEPKTFSIFPKYTQKTFMEIQKANLEKEIISFLNKLPHYYILNNKFLLVHGNLKQFDFLTTTLQNCLYGNADYADIEYQSRFNNKELKLTLVRGHKQQEEICYDKCPNIISLETGCYEDGFISGIRIEDLYRLNKSNIIKIATNYCYNKPL